MKSVSTLTKGLAWFGIGLGVAKILAPAKVSKLTGSPNNPTLSRVFGAREIISGISTLNGRTSKIGIWSRVAGDILDLGVLGAGFLDKKNPKTRLSLNTAAVAARTAMDIFAARSSRPYARLFSSR